MSMIRSMRRGIKRRLLLKARGRSLNYFRRKSAQRRAVAKAAQKAEG